MAGAEAIRQLTGLPAVIKWPNDLYVDGRKVAGILTEMSSEMDMIFYVVVGIGINVNTSSFPTEVSASATSLALEQGRSVCRRQLLQLLLEKLEYWDQILSADQDQILERWRQLTITLGKRVSVYSPNFTVHGLALDIDHEGALLLETETGKK